MAATARKKKKTKHHRPERFAQKTRGPVRQGCRLGGGDATSNRSHSWLVVFRATVCQRKRGCHKRSGWSHNFPPRGRGFRGLSPQRSTFLFATQVFPKYPPRAAPLASGQGVLLTQKEKQKRIPVENGVALFPLNHSRSYLCLTSWLAMDCKGLPVLT